MYIRRLHEQDWAAYRTLRLRGLEEHPEAFGSSLEEEAAMPPDAWVRRLTSERYMLGAFQEEKLVGSVGLVREGKLKLRHKGSIVGMYVAPEARRGGVALALMQEVIELGRQERLEQILLTVASENTPAKQLYLSLGFVTFGEEPRALKIGDRYVDETYMILRLL